MLNPLEQFFVKSVVNFSVFSHNIQITNSTLTFLTTYLIILLLTRVACYKISLVPGKVQACGEAVFLLIDGMLLSTAGKGSQKFFTLIFSLFMFILISNSIGMIPSVFTTTSHISVTFTLAIFVFIVITVVGFVKNGVGYFSILLPKGTPIFLAPLIIFIELFDFY